MDNDKVTKNLEEENVKDEIQDEKQSEEVTEVVEEKGEEENTEETSDKEELEPMESIVEVNTTYDYRTLKYANMYVLRVKRKTRLVSIIMACISLVVGVLVLLFLEESKWLSALFGILCVFTVYNVFTDEQKLDRSIKGFFSTHAKFVQKFSINDDKIRVTAEIDGQERTADYSWPYIQEIHAIPEFYYLFLNSGSPIVLDRSEGAITKGSQAELDEIIKKQAETKPFKVYDKVLVKKLVDVTYFEPTTTIDENSENEPVEAEIMESDKVDESNDKSDDKSSNDIK